MTLFTVKKMDIIIVADVVYCQLCRPL